MLKAVQKEKSYLEFVVLFFLLWRALTFLFAVVAQTILPQIYTFTPAYDRHFRAYLPYLFWIWGNFDGNHYMDIAYRGYQNLEQAFFPLFPLAIRLGVEISHVPYVLSAVVISQVAFAISLFLFLKLLQIDWPNAPKSLFLLSVVLFPTAFYYGAVYNDSLFLLFATLSLLASRKQQWGRAGFWAALATLTRLNGIVLFGYLLIEYVQRKNVNSEDTWVIKNWPGQIKSFFNLRQIWQNRIWSVLLIPAAFFGYLAYIQVFFGSWRMLFTTMSVWKQDKIVLPPQVIWRYIKILSLAPTDRLIFWVAAIEFAAVIFYLFLLALSWRRIRFSYWMFFAVSILIPWLTGSFQGMPRYGLHLYPMFLALTIFLSEESQEVVVSTFVIFIILSFFCLALFTRGYFIA
jgi:hypothetical protein